MLGLSATEKSWPVGGWVLKLFKMIMQKLKSPTYRRTSKPHEQPKPSDSPARATGPGSNTNGGLYPNNPGLGTRNSMEDPRQRHHDAGYPPVFDNNTQNALYPPSSSFADLDYDIPNMFMFDGNMSDVNSNHDNFFQWLELPSSHDVNYS